MQNNQVSNYTEDSIKVLEGLEAVRKRPAMYIGDISERGLHHLIQEVVDNSIDEALAGYCKNIKVTIHQDGSCSVIDDGRGIPTGPHPVKKISTLEVVMCTLHAGGKFDKNTYKVSGGLHGVGVSCVNALSSFMEVLIRRDGKIFRQHYRMGTPVTPVEEVGTTKETGTTVKFFPDHTIFTTTTFKASRISHRLRELAFLNKDLRLTLIDEINGTEDLFHYENGLVDFVNYIEESKEKTNYVDAIYFSGKHVAENDVQTEVEICFKYNTEFDENLISFVNNINTVEGGTHVSGFRSSITRTLNNYSSQINVSSKSKDISLIGDDFREGLTAVISVKVAEPQFEGQTKTKLGNGEIEGIVRNIVTEQLVEFLDANPTIIRRILEKAYLAAEARISSRKQRELVRRKGVLESTLLPGKLADCSNKDSDSTELYIVEGDSAGGSAKQGRDRRFQAILPLKGKILNVHKAQERKILSNEEVKAMIMAIGAGWKDDFDAAKTRYGKIILMADADVDGSHIRTLLLTFFFDHMQELILTGKLYIAQPPLYKLKKGKLEYYAYNDAERDEYIERIRKESPSKSKQSDENIVIGDDGVIKIDGITMQRFKGLGEMNPEQLWETTMNPETRTLLQVSINDIFVASGIFDTLMGDKVEPRRAFIESNAQYVKNLDV